MQIGDIVVSKDNERDPLRSGCEYYDKAVCVQAEPFTLVSLGGDMRWNNRNKEQHAVVGRASKTQLAVCMQRLHKDNRNVP